MIKFFKILVYLCTLAIVGIGSYVGYIYKTTTPTNTASWVSEQRVLASAELSQDNVTVRNVRDFRFTSTSTFEAHYYDKSFKVSDIERVWFAVSPFDGIPGSAHTFVSFELKDKTFLAVSVEIRKQFGEKYSPFSGVLNEYELYYVVADERDVIPLRASVYKDNVYLYPSSAKPAAAQALFKSMMARVNSLNEKPEFYNTLWNNCTTNIVRHIKEANPANPLPRLSWRYILPEHSDAIALEFGLLDTDLSLEAAREKFNITQKAIEYKNDADFSKKIRGI